jgi:dipeptidyl aminopeptidase/acylaminoacyl peptidase
MIALKICRTILLGCIAALGPLAAQSISLEKLLEEASAVREFKAVSISPDGSRVGWVERLSPEQYGVFERAVNGGGSAVRIATTASKETEIAWSPDSRRVAYFSDSETKGQPNIFTADVPGGKPRRLTNLRGFAKALRWSPDGSEIGFLYTADAPKSGGPTEPTAREVGVIEQQIYEQRIAVVDAGHGKLRLISPADLYVYEFDWSPDSRQFAAIAAPGSGDNNWWIAALYTIGKEAGQATKLPSPGQQLAVPRWSPDGRTIAFIGGLMSDAGVVGGEIFTVPAQGGKPASVTPGMKLSASGIEWAPSSRRIVFTAAAGGGSAIASLDLASGQIETVWKGGELIKAGEDSPLSLSKDGRSSAMTRSSWSLAPEVWAGEIGSWKQVTGRNKERKQLWGSAADLKWQSDGFPVQGWLLAPRKVEPGRRYPLIVNVHGGPSSSKKPAWPESDDNSLLASQGFYVLFPNPRGSYGAGETFTQANVKDFGAGDLRDILAGVEAAVKAAPIDPERVGITGWSYGGYMTMWTVTQTNRFRAAVAGAGIANWKSYYGQNSIDQWMIPFFGSSVYDDPAVYAKSSPIEYIRNVKTPTLILVGERDAECPAPQSYEFWHALKTLGVKTQLVVYDGEGHHFNKPEHKLDRMRRTIEWFRENM